MPGMEGRYMLMPSGLTAATATSNAIKDGEAGLFTLGEGDIGSSSGGVGCPPNGRHEGPPPFGSVIARETLMPIKSQQAKNPRRFDHPNVSTRPPLKMASGGI
jgi:hypothetical protein